MDQFKDDERVKELLTEINKELMVKLSEKRYQHSVGVMKKAEELAKLYGVNINKAKLVGLAHDIGKELSDEEKIQYAKDNNISVDEVEKINIGLLHAKIGADICKKKYQFSEDMQKAIEYHTTGNKNMDILAKVIFVADKIEDGREYKDEWKMKQLNEVRDLAKENIDRALLYEIDSSINYTIQKKKLIHPDSIYTRNMIIVEIQNNKH